MLLMLFSQGVLLSLMNTAKAEEIEKACYCKVRYEERGEYVDIMESPKFDLEDCSKIMECRKICRNLYDTLGAGDLSYFVFKERKTIGQMFCGALAEKNTMKVEKKTIELFSQVCEDPMEPVNRESKGRDFCCVLGKYFDCQNGDHE